MSDMKLKARRGGQINDDRKPFIAGKYPGRRNEVIMKKCLIISVGLLLASQSFAAMHSLTTNFGDVILSSMKPGMVYSLKKEENLPFKVINNAEKKRDIEVTVQVPIISQMTKNYDSIPDVSWISVFPSRFQLEPGESIDCDIIISIPPDEKFENRHFQAMIETKSAGKPGGQGISISFALSSRLRFSTGPRPEKIMDEYRQKIFQALQLEFSPMSLFIRDEIPIGKKVKLNGDVFETAQVVNKGKKAYKLKLRLDKKPKEYGLKPQYELLPKEIKVTFKKKKVKVKSRSIQDIEMQIEIPAEEEFYGKSYAFVVTGTVLDFDIPIEIFSRVYFKTEEKK